MWIFLIAEISVRQQMAFLLKFCRIFWHQARTRVFVMFNIYVQEKCSMSVSNAMEPKTLSTHNPSSAYPCMCIECAYYLGKYSASFKLHSRIAPFCLCTRGIRETEWYNVWVWHEKLLLTIPLHQRMLFLIVSIADPTGSDQMRTGERMHISSTPSSFKTFTYYHIFQVTKRILRELSTEAGWKLYSLPRSHGLVHFDSVWFGSVAIASHSLLTGLKEIEATRMEALAYHKYVSCFSLCCSPLFCISDRNVHYTAPFAIFTTMIY